MVLKSNNAFGTLGTWTDYERGYGDPNWKDKNWGGWEATDADFFGEARKFFEGHQHYGQYVGDYGSKNLFDSFGGEYSYYNPGKTVGSHNKWKNNKANLFRLAKDLYYYELKNPLAPEPEPEPAPAPPAPEPAPEPPPIEPQPIDLSKYISQEDLAKHQASWDAQFQLQQAGHQAELLAAQQQWQADSAAALQQAQTSWADQYAASLQQAKSDWSKEFTSAEQQWAETAAKEQQDIRSSLLDDFKTQTAAKDRVYETQIDELKSLYAEQESDWKDQANLYEQVLADQQSSWDAQFKDQANLYAQQQAQQQAGWDKQAGVYESTIGSQQSAIDDFKTQLTDFRDTIQGQQATIGEIEAERAHQAGQIKAYQERDIQDAERARIAATYGQSGKPMNQAVKGVRTQNELPQSKPKFTSSFFGRGGNRIKNTSLNIA